MATPISPGGAWHEKIWDLTYRSSVQFGPCLRVWGRKETSCQTGGPAHKSRETSASGSTGAPKGRANEAGTSEAGTSEVGASEVVSGLLTAV